MPFILTRIDDRLIHGQVVLGWGSFLNPDRILLCSDSVAADEKLRDILTDAECLLSEKLDISVWTRQQTIDYTSGKQFSNERVLLLVESPEEVFHLVEAGLPIEHVNVGGMHFRRGKIQVAPYIFVDEEDVKYFKILNERKIRLEGQDVPTSRKIDVGEIIELM